ncbi:hypothetical protein O7628_17155 [Micromonospora sp. WMMD956]|uniref:hypothetical protein n=1 Tax=Micromonospora sp. WMMD956 TaxID=3016108 RepID=UPI0024169707|nr:hypothetical protein [Micromonospora sp. WMMD956]MDG4817224.1 hypothetical protein [Micromonospora sp. WMMD956]
MTGRRAAQGHEEPPGAAAPAPPAQAGPPTQAGPPGQAGQPGPPTQSGPPALPGQAAGPDQPVEVEPTTGAPVDAVPRRVPVRQPGGRLRPTPAPDEDASGDDDGLFWAPIEQVHWDGTPLREEHGRRRWWWRRATDADPRGEARRRRADRPAHPPDPWQGLSALLALSLLAAFFAWVSAGPFWLALGHATTGTVVIGECTGAGLTQRCRGVFTAEGERFIAFGVRVSGVPAERAAAGSTLTARMTGPSGDTAYADTGAGRHLRWLLGLLLVLACGAGIARYTGAARLADRRARRWAVAMAVAGPLVISVGFLAAAW